MIVFGKSAQNILSLKQDFFSQNATLLAELERVNALYAEQPPRRTCKLCDAPLSGKADFTKHRVGYAFCGRCGHLNGLHQDTDTFCRAIYSDRGGSDYAKTYAAADREAYYKRVDAIYVPKAQFLADALREQGLGVEQASCTDIGAGSGYFVAALRGRGFGRAHGYEVSRAQSELAAHMLSADAVRYHDPDELRPIVEKLDSDVISMVGVLEHLQEPRSILAALRENRRVKFLFLSVPLFSPCVFLEAIFPAVMPRHLSGAHTHLFTNSSLAWMAEEFGMSRVAEWWFGSDMMDLYRSVLVSLQDGSQTDALAGRWQDIFVSVLDELQLQFDRQKLSSEVHALFRLKRDA